MAKKSSSPSSTVRMVLQSITVGRDAKAVALPVGQPFEFTAEEIEQIERMNPGAISTLVTLDVNDAASVRAVSATPGQQDAEGL